MKAMMAFRLIIKLGILTSEELWLWDLLLTTELRSFYHLSWKC